MTTKHRARLIAYVFHRHRFIVLSLIFKIFVYNQIKTHAQDVNNFSTNSCDALGSCSPSSCITSTDATCTISKTQPDFASTIREIKCSSSCSQSINSMCTTSYLKSILKSDAGIKAAYCTDSNLVLWSTSKPRYDPATSDDYLNSVPLPPGGDGGCRVRTSSALLTVYKIPITPPTSQTTSNVIPQPLPNVSGMPAAGAIAVGVDGVPMFPNYNNRGLPAATSCEIDRCNAHSGKGDDYHYHGDPFGTKCLYSESDFVGKSHPPIIGFSLDGYLIYGRHIRAGLDGEGINLDSCGGHEHDSLGYHYHSTVSENLVTNSLDGVSGSGPFTYNTYDIAPTTCWKADVSKITNFWSGSQAAYDRSKSGTSDTWIDIENIQPCCQSTHFLTAHGISVDGTGTCADTVSCTFGTGEGASTNYEECDSATSTCCNTANSDQTKNNLSYSCNARNIEIANSYEASPSSLTNNFVCVQAQVTSSLASTSANIDCSGVGSGVIYCISFASVGQVSGSCGSCESSMTDGTCHAYLPESVGESCIGESSCNLKLSLNGASSSTASTTVPFVTSAHSTPANTEINANTCGSGTINFKLLAYCGPSTGSTSSSTQTSITLCASGLDNTGKECPKDNSNGKPCPPGCELTQASPPPPTFSPPPPTKSPPPPTSSPPPPTSSPPPPISSPPPPISSPPPPIKSPPPPPASSPPPPTPIAPLVVSRVDVVVDIIGESSATFTTRKQLDYRKSIAKVSKVDGGFVNVEIQGYVDIYTRRSLLSSYAALRVNTSINPPPTNVSSVITTTLATGMAIGELTSELQSLGFTSVTGTGISSVTTDGVLSTSIVDEPLAGPSGSGIVISRTASSTNSSTQTSFSNFLQTLVNSNIYSANIVSGLATCDAWCDSDCNSWPRNKCSSPSTGTCQCENADEFVPIVVVAAVLGLLVLIFIAYLCCCKSKKKEIKPNVMMTPLH